MVVLEQSDSLPGGSESRRVETDLTDDLPCAGFRHKAPGSLTASAVDD
jgi:hypothetical protein